MRTRPSGGRPARWMSSWPRHGFGNARGALAASALVWTTQLETHVRSGMKVNVARQGVLKWKAGWTSNGS